MKKTDALAVVPLNTQLLEELPINGDKNLTVDVKKHLLEVLIRTFNRKRMALEQHKNEIKRKVYDAERKRVGWTELKRRVDTIERKRALLSKEVEEIEEKMQDLGFDDTGKLVSLYHLPEHNSYLKARKAKITKIVEGIQTKVGLAIESFEGYALKFDKVETRLMLASTYEEAMTIMHAVLGNGDTMLEPPVIETEYIEEDDE